VIPDRLLTVIREFTENVVNPFDLDELLHRLLRQTIEVVDAAGAGIMLADDRGELHFVAASEERIVDAEREQTRLESGACFEAYTTGRIVVVKDLKTETRWPHYADHVTGLGLRAVLGVPMHAGGQRIGVMNIYQGVPTRWTHEQITTAEIVTAMGAGYVLNANQLRAQHELGEQLQAAIDSRDLIGQAKGILMSHGQVSADEAFELLRTRSQQQNRRLRDVAEAIICEQESTT